MSFDVEAALISFLQTKTGVATFADVPNPRPTEFLTVERTGGPRTDLVVDNPMIAVQCWSTSRARASQLARVVDAALALFAFEPHVHKVERTSLYNFPDEQGSQARYQLVVQIKTI